MLVVLVVMLPIFRWETPSNHHSIIHQTWTEQSQYAFNLLNFPSGAGAHTRTLSVYLQIFQNFFTIFSSNFSCFHLDIKIAYSTTILYIHSIIFRTLLWTSQTWTAFCGNYSQLGVFTMHFLRFAFPQISLPKFSSHFSMLFLCFCCFL